MSDCLFYRYCAEDLTQPELSSEQIEMERKTHYMIDKKPIKWKELDDGISIKLEEMANRDGLTGAFNKAFMHKKLD